MVRPSSFTPLLRSGYPALPLQHCLPRRRTLATVANGTGAAGKKLRMIILGAPGAGKGTQSDWLLQKYDIDAIVVGQLLRNEIVKGTALGQYAEKTMKAGALLADDIVLDLVKPEIEKLEDRSWYWSASILDGFPRKASQAVLLDKILAERGDHLNFVASLRVPDKLSFNPPKTPGKDDVTGEPLSQRPDDNAATFANRLRSFHAENDPLLAHYDGAVVPFVGETSKEIWPKLESAIEEKFPNLKLR
ncbi:SPOSA6832_01322, partial [Sporobolomyces salmonicolor]